MKYIFGMAWVFAVLVPGAVQAYQMTGSSALQLNDTTYLFTIEYQLGFEKYDIAAPIGAVRNGPSDTPYLNYSFTHNDELEIGGSATALVLSTAQVQGTQYFVPRGESRSFRLFAVLSFAEATQLAGVALEVTKLPFSLTAEGSTLSNGLSSGELQTFVTPQIK